MCVTSALVSHLSTQDVLLVVTSALSITTSSIALLLLLPSAPTAGVTSAAIQASIPANGRHLLENSTALNAQDVYSRWAQCPKLPLRKRLRAGLGVCWQRSGMAEELCVGCVQQVGLWMARNFPSEKKGGLSRAVGCCWQRPGRAALWTLRLVTFQSFWLEKVATVKINIL